MLIVAVGAMRGIQAMALDSPNKAAAYLALAFAFNLLMQAVGFAVSKIAKMDQRDALTMGVCFGNRNVSLAAVASSAFLATHADSALYMAMSFLPIFILPQLQSFWLRAPEISLPAIEPVFDAFETSIEIKHGIIELVDFQPTQSLEPDTVQDASPNR